MSDIKYRVGELTDIRDTDPTFDTEAEALKEAEAIRERHSYDVPIIGIWDAEDGELLVIVYEGWEYRP